LISATVDDSAVCSVKCSVVTNWTAADAGSGSG
jgi:hypothetical protein